jgi:hypothetical protein
MNKEEQIKLVHSTLLEEYKSLREEIISTSESSRQILYFTLVAIGVLISGSIYINDSGRHYMFLIVPFLFYSLILTQLKYLFFIIEFGDYIREVISPHIRKNLAELSDDEESNIELILNWECNKKNLIRSRYSILFLPITIADISISFITATLSFIAYCVLKNFNFQNISDFDKILIAFNVLMFVYCIYWGARVEYKPKKRTETPNH